MFHLRAAEPRDFDAIRALRESVLDLPDAPVLSLDRERFLRVANAHHLADIADSAEFWVVAEGASGVIAWIHAGVRSDGAGAGTRDFVEIVMVFVLACERRHGIARALLLEVERLTRTRGIGLLRLVVHTSNAGAIRLYEAIGYVAGHGMMEKRLPAIA
jgi:ribosomal protein S18 acetylase RimI-like enzyme